MYQEKESGLMTHFWHSGFFLRNIFNLSFSLQARPVGYILRLYKNMISTINYHVCGSVESE